MFVDKTKNVAGIEIGQIEFKKIIIEKTFENDFDFSKIQDKIKATYIYYNVYLKDEKICSLDNIEQVEELSKQMPNEKITYSQEKTNLSNEIVTVDNESAILLLENSSIVQQTNLLLNDFANVNGVIFDTIPLKGQISSRYGERSRIRSQDHTGLDIATPAGENIFAASNGTVEFAGYQGSYGNLVILDHGNGVKSYYGHCKQLLVTQGQIVESGTVIATVGSTGNSTGPHLHFEIRLDDQTLNPEDYLY